MACNKKIAPNVYNSCNIPVWDMIFVDKLENNLKT